jgi:peptidoglycan/xylan/chitin deacetylase (PgdA/CDA1 family)
LAVSRRRWWAKKAARRSLLELSALFGGLPTRDGGEGRVRALTYHRFGAARRDPFSVSEADFAAQMEWLAEGGRALSLSALADFVAGRAGAPRDGVLVTIDDGSASLLGIAAPILARHRIPAVAFVCPGLVGRDGSPLGAPERNLGWDELAKLAEAGLVLGSHSLTHRSLAALEDSELREELARSRELIEARLGSRVDAFAYPFGTRADFDARTTRLLRECGYRIAFTSQHGAIRAGQDPLLLPRTKVEGGEGLRPFRLLCAGAMDAWRAVDRALWRVQRPAVARVSGRGAPSPPAR